MNHRKERCKHYITKIKDIMNIDVNGTVLVDGIDYRDIIALQEFSDNAMIEYEDSLDRHTIEVIANGKTSMILDVPSEFCSSYLFKTVKDLKTKRLCDILQGKDVYEYSNHLFVREGNIYRFIAKGYFAIHKNNKSDPMKVNTTFIYYKETESISIEVRVVDRFSEGGEFSGEYPLDKDTALKLVGKTREEIVSYLLNNDKYYLEFASKFEDRKHEEMRMNK